MKPPTRTNDSRWKNLRKSLLPTIDCCNRCLTPLSQDGVGAELHHILPYSKYPHLEYEQNNLIWLCERCNRKIGADVEMRSNFVNRNWI